MIFDIDMISEVSRVFLKELRKPKGAETPVDFNRENSLFSPLGGVPLKNYQRANDYVDFAPDRVAMQDATAQMALLQLMNSGRTNVAVPSTVHCDHLIQAYKDAGTDLETAKITNQEVFEFLETCPTSTASAFGNRVQVLSTRWFLRTTRSRAE